MKFLSVLFKVIAIILLLAAIVLCAFGAIEMSGYNDPPEIALIVGLIFLGGILIFLFVFSLGMVLNRVHNIERRMTLLEQSSLRPAAVHITPEPKSAEARPAQPERPVQTERPRSATRSIGFDAPDLGAAPPKTAPSTAYSAPRTYASNPAAAAPVAKRSNNTLVIVLCVILAVVVVFGAAAAILITALGRARDAVIDYAENNSIIDIEVDDPITFPEEEDEPAELNAQQLVMGESVVTDFVTMNFDNYIVDYDVSYSVTTGYVTRHTGPDPLPGQKYICLTGTIQNTSTSPLPVYDFFIGNFSLDGYNYTVGANDIDILDGEGQTESQIAPLMTYDFRLYVAIPESLADSFSSASFTFGFYDGFENEELSYVRAFEDEPIAHCPYQYELKLK